MHEIKNVQLDLFDTASRTILPIEKNLSVQFDHDKETKLLFVSNNEVVFYCNLDDHINLGRLSNDSVSIYAPKMGVDENKSSYIAKFPDEETTKKCAKDYIDSRKKQTVVKSDFDKRTEEWSAVQYFQFYSYLSQQQNMMQDYIRTSTYQRAIQINSRMDFHGKVVLDVGAGSGILSFFAAQSGAKRVYAVEASNMAAHCETLVQANKMAGRIVVLSGKIEELVLPEPVDVIISEPMGYMLFNERMLETYVHARKFLDKKHRQPILDAKGNPTELYSNKAVIRNGIMFPTIAYMYIAPFSDEALFAEQHTKANFWYQQSFHGMDLSSLRAAASEEYFNQPVVDTFDINICPALPKMHKVDFRSIEEDELADIEIPLDFQIHTCSTIHGLAFWFDVGFLGSQRDTWLSTAPTEPLTHWYQVRCLIGTALFVQEGQNLRGLVRMKANKRQSYDVDIELIVPGTTSKISNKLDLKNPHFRYTGYSAAPPPGSHTKAPTEVYIANNAAATTGQSGNTSAFLTTQSPGPAGDSIYNNQTSAAQQTVQNFLNQSQAAVHNSSYAATTGTIGDTFNLWQSVSQQSGDLKQPQQPFTLNANVVPTVPPSNTNQQSQLNSS